MLSAVAWMFLFPYLDLGQNLTAIANNPQIPAVHKEAERDG